MQKAVSHRQLSRMEQQSVPEQCSSTKFGHRPAQQVAAHRCKMVIGMLRSSYRTNELDNLLWRGHES